MSLISSSCLHITPYGSRGFSRKKSWLFDRDVAPDLMNESRSVDGCEDNIDAMHYMNR